LQHISYTKVGLKYLLSPYDNPVAHVKPKETIKVTTEDACSGQIQNEDDARDREKIPFGNPVVGPIFVEGADKGDTLCVTIEEISAPTKQGVTYFSEFNDVYVAGTPILKFMDIAFPRKPLICKIDDKFVYGPRKIKLPYRPMIGTIAVAPMLQNEAASSGVSPGCHGGNMDIMEIGPASTIFLPVFHKGALLYIGDAHAVQGNGEISGNAVEIRAEVKLKIDLSKERINLPRVETNNEVMYIATTRAGRNLEDAIRTAFFELVLWMEEHYNLNRFEGLMLCSHIGKISIGNLWTAAAKIEKKYLPPI